MKEQIEALEEENQRYLDTLIRHSKGERMGTSNTVRTIDQASEKPVLTEQFNAFENNSPQIHQSHPKTAAKKKDPTHVAPILSA